MSGTEWMIEKKLSEKKTICVFGISFYFSISKKSAYEKFGMNTNSESAFM